LKASGSGFNGSYLLRDCTLVLEDLGPLVWDLLFRVWGFGFGFWGLGSGVWGSGWVDACLLNAIRASCTSRLLGAAIDSFCQHTRCGHGFRGWAQQCHRTIAFQSAAAGDFEKKVHQNDSGTHLIHSCGFQPEHPPKTRGERSRVAALWARPNVSSQHSSGATRVFSKAN
jgi:hypothetical protein